MRYRTRSDLNIYAVMVNGVHVENVSAKNSRSAILAYCRSNGVAVGLGVAMGQCGIQAKYCSKSPYNGRRQCGNFGKCHTYYVVETEIGEVTAVPTPMGGIGH